MAEGSHASSLRHQWQLSQSAVTAREEGGQPETVVQAARGAGGWFGENMAQHPGKTMYQQGAQAPPVSVGLSGS